MSGRRGFIKTVEVLLVVILTTVFLLAILPPQGTGDPAAQRKALLFLEEDPGFRAIASSQQGCINASASPAIGPLIDRYLPKRFDYTFCAGGGSQSLPLKDVQVETLFFAGNSTALRFRTLRLYTWSR